jgi:hypothetical protein
LSPGWSWSVVRVDLVFSSSVIVSTMDIEYESTTDPESLIPIWCKATIPPKIGEPSPLTQARGWPWRAFACDWVWDDDNGDFTDVSHGGIYLPLNDGVTHRVEDMHAFPLRPIWLGIIGDSVLFGALVLGLHRLMYSARCFSRRRCGLCAKCGYDMRSSFGACPECGTQERSSDGGTHC